VRAKEFFLCARVRIYSVNMVYVFGFIGIVVGALMVIKTETLVSNFGRSGWAEDHIGPGGSYLFYKLLGIGLVALSLMMMTGMLQELLLGFFVPLFGGAR
jgi:hypothetical protein